jgi:sterol desaturase/sphingolipid hydroxylase (fatty acid hydroxylase superfamily)
VSYILEGAFFLAGLGHQILSGLLPFRRQSAPRALRLDLVAVMLFVLLASAYDLGVEGPLAEWWLSQPAIERWYAIVEQWPPFVIFLLSLLFADFIVYWTHRSLHTKFLWHTHAFHHSSKHVWWLSGLRSSPVHAVLTALPDTIAFLTFPPASTAWFVGLVLFQFCNQHWIHSNIAVPHAPMLEKLFVTPRVHFVHHSANVRYTNSNYAFLFTVWDRMFGTFTDPDRVSPDEPLGLDYDNTPWRMMLGLPPSRAQQERANAPEAARV